LFLPFYFSFPSKPTSLLCFRFIVPLVPSFRNAVKGSSIVTYRGSFRGQAGYLPKVNIRDPRLI
jgi:hypothetical protein